jgi:hypothetical protein
VDSACRPYCIRALAGPALPQRCHEAGGDRCPGPEGFDMKDATLAAIAEELARLRERLARGKVRHAAVFLFLADPEGGPDKVYSSVVAPTEREAKAFIGRCMLEAFVRGGLMTEQEVDDA